MVKTPLMSRRYSALTSAGSLRNFPTMKGFSFKSKALDGLSDVRIQKRLGITFDTLKAMKVNIRKQIQLSFAG